MPKPYSIDLRERVINAYHHGKNPIKRKENTLSGVAERFGISVKCVKNGLKLYRQTKNVTPKPHSGGQTPKISVEGLKFLRQTVNQQPDLTIGEYLEIYNRSVFNPVSASTIERALKKLKLSRKKKHSVILESMRLAINSNVNCIN